MQRYFAINKDNDKLILKESDIHHIKKVMRMKIGDKLEVIYDKINYLCEIDNLDSFNIKILEVQDEDNEMDLDVTIAIGLVKEQKMDLILQKLTELGVKRIIPLKLERSIVKLDDNKYKKKLERWNNICKEASEQAHRNIIPEITDQMTISELLRLDYKDKYVCSTIEEDNLLVNYIEKFSKCDRIIFVIGPEGGISTKEEETLVNNGYIPISFGTRILRVETAAIFIASILNICSKR